MSVVRQQKAAPGAPVPAKSEGGGFLARAWSKLSGKESGGEQTHAHVVSPEARVPVVRYVEALLCRLLQKQETSIALRAADKLPDVGIPADASLSYTKVVNRLKVLAGLYPVDYPKPTEGHFRYEWQGRYYEVRLSCDDRGASASCRVTVSDPLPNP